MISIYNLSLSSSTFEKKENELLSYISPERKKRVLSYHHPIDQKLSLYGQLLIKIGIHRLTKIHFEQMQFSTNMHGKPILLNDSLYFNLSHTRNHVLCVFSTKVEVGADVEKIENAPFEIMNNFFHTKEIEYINTPYKDRAFLFYDVWTKKEAYLKMIGTGLHDRISEINILSCPFTIETYQVEQYLCSVCFNQAHDYSIKNINISEKQIYDYITINSCIGT